MIATTSVLSHVPQLTRAKSHNKNYTIVIIIVILSTSFLSSKCRLRKKNKWGGNCENYDSEHGKLMFSYTREKLKI